MNNNNYDDNQIDYNNTLYNNECSTIGKCLLIAKSDEHCQCSFTFQEALGIDSRNKISYLVRLNDGSYCHHFYSQFVNYGFCRTMARLIPCIIFGSGESVVNKKIKSFIKEEIIIKLSTSSFSKNWTNFFGSTIRIIEQTPNFRFEDNNLIKSIDLIGVNQIQINWYNRMTIGYQDLSIYKIFLFIFVATAIEMLISVLNNHPKYNQQLVEFQDYLNVQFKPNSVGLNIFKSLTKIFRKIQLFSHDINKEVYYNKDVKEFLDFDLYTK